jgi:hypothetical protein
MLTLATGATLLRRRRDGKEANPDFVAKATTPA